MQTIQRSENGAGDKRPELLFANFHAAMNGSVSGHEPYLLTCRFFRCGIIDRTRTLETGFESIVLDEIDTALEATDTAAEFAVNCRRRAEQLVERALEQNRGIQVLWSGGIDSTVALIALIEECRQRRQTELLDVLLSVDSINEYPEFYHQHIRNKLRVLPIGFPISSYLDSSRLIVTGEHGDQLFGSDYLKDYVENGLAFLPWRETLPLILAHQELSPDEAAVVQEYLTPLMDACPRPLETVFDFFWWLNFTLKWQMVTLRIPANAGENAEAVYRATEHFFRTPEFQHWSIFHHVRREISWPEYKMPSKQFIFEFTGDANYMDSKEKEQSLKLVFAGEPDPKRRKKRAARASAAVALKADFQPMLLDVV